MASGFDVSAVIAEYRALRASVLRLWRASGPTPDLRDVDDVTRFNESIDQSLTRAVRSYTQLVERDRETSWRTNRPRGGTPKRPAAPRISFSPR